MATGNVLVEDATARFAPPVARSLALSNNVKIVTKLSTTRMDFMQ
jgi:hypothetical protein